MPEQRHPWTYRGQPASGGRLNPRDPATPNHPTHRGRLYVVGHGWLWVSGWQQADGSIRLAADPMSSAQVDQFCAPHVQQVARQAPLSDLMAPGAGAQLAGDVQGTRDHAAERPRTPPGAREPARGSHRGSEGSLPLQGGVSGRQAQVARAGRNRPSSEKSAEATEAGMRELNDDIPF